MARVQSDIKYSLSDLSAACRGTWAEFASWADPRLPSPPHRVSDSIWRFRHGYHQHRSARRWLAEREDWRQVILQAIESCESQMRGVFGPDDYEVVKPTKGLDRYSGRITIITLDTCKDESPLRRSSLIRDLVDTVFDDVDSLDASLAGAITRMQAEIEAGVLSKTGEWLLAELDLLRMGLQGSEMVERAFWTTLKVRLLLDIRWMQEFDRRVKKSLVPDGVLVTRLSGLLSGGNVQLTVTRSEHGKSTVSNIFGVDLAELSDAGVFFVYRKALLSPLAFQLAVQWEASQDWPRWAVQCRNPMCGEIFYTGRRNVRTCSRSPGSGRRSKCKAVWDAYRKWLQKIGAEPEEAWQDKELASQFIAQYSPRGFQSSGS